MPQPGKKIIMRQALHQHYTPLFIHCFSAMWVLPMAPLIKNHSYAYDIVRNNSLFHNMQSISLQVIQYPRILLSVVTRSSPSECNLGNITTDSCYSKSSCGCELISWKVDVIIVDHVRVYFVTVDLMCTPLRFW